MSRTDLDAVLVETVGDAEPAAVEGELDRDSSIGKVTVRGPPLEMRHLT